MKEAPAPSLADFPQLEPAQSKDLMFVIIIKLFKEIIIKFVGFSGSDLFKAYKNPGATKKKKNKETKSDENAKTASKGIFLLLVPHIFLLDKPS